jgi:hypothetical protein
MSGTRYHVNVTQRHINSATPKDSSHCMIADAVRETIPGANRIAVDLQTIRWTDPAKGKRYVCFTPPSAQQALLAFDQGQPVIPFSIALRPVQILPAGARQAREPREIQPPITDSAGGAQTSPTVTGGHALPMGSLSNRKGRRRAFGLRQANQ